MITPGKEQDETKKAEFPEQEKDWENPKNPEGTQDARDKEQLQRQLEEAERRKENLSDNGN